MGINFKPQEDWAMAYAAFDGTMKQCLGRDCSASCCNSKKIISWRHGEIQYRTTLDESEYSYQLSRFGPFPSEVETELVDIRLMSKMRYLVRGCIADDGSCRLKDRKPIQCRIFPFSPSEDRPLELKHCPHAKLIADDPQAKQHIISVRRALGFTDNEKWVVELDRILQNTDDSDF